MNNHPGYDLLILCASGHLDAPTEALVAAHLEGCADCAWRLLSSGALELPRFWPRSAAALRAAHDRPVAMVPAKADWIELLRVSLSELSARIGGLLSAPLFSPAVRGGSEPPEEPAERYLWLYRGRFGEQLEYELGLWLRKSPSPGQRAREFSCALWSRDNGEPVAGRAVRLKISGGGRPGAGELGSGVALTDESGLAHFPVWIGGEWLNPESAANWPGAARDGEAGLFLVELLA